MPNVVILPHVIEQKLAENERQEVIGFLNELIFDTTDEVKRDLIEILEERFERRLSEQIINLKVEMTEKIADSETRLTERIANSEVKLAEMIANSEVKLTEKIVSSEARSAKNTADLEVKLTEKIANSETKLTGMIANSETKLTGKINENKAEMIKWMFIFWLGNIITIIGGIVGILKIAKVF